MRVQVSGKASEGSRAALGDEVGKAGLWVGETRLHGNGLRGHAPQEPQVVGRRWKGDGDPVQPGVRLAHVICAATEPRSPTASARAQPLALSQPSPGPWALVLVVCSRSPYPQGCELWPEVKITP